MNAKRVAAAAGVICAAQKTKQTAAGIAASLEAAGLLQSPETAAELATLREQAEKTTGFCGQRAEYITALLNCNPDNGHDYDRWQGHAAARRQLSELLGLPVAWPAETEPRTVTEDVAPQVAKLRAILAPSAGELAEQRHLVNPLDHVLEHLADERPAVTS